MECAIDDVVAVEEDDNGVQALHQMHVLLVLHGMANEGRDCKVVLQPHGQGALDSSEESNLCGLHVSVINQGALVRLDCSEG